MVSGHITVLLVAYFAYMATEEQRLELDKWICDSDENMRVFEQCLEASLSQQQFDPDRQEEFDLCSLANQLN